MSFFEATTCPACGSPLRERDISRETMAGRCPACRTLVDLQAAGLAAAPALADAGPGEAREVMPVPMPARVHVETRGRDLVVVRRWFSWTYLLLLVFCVIWFGFLATWYGIVFATDAPLAFKLFPLIHVAAGLVIAYLTLTGFLNRTTLRIERDHLTVRHGPLPWPGNLDVSTLQLEQLFCTQKISRGRNGVSLRYNVEALTRDGRHLKVVQGLDTREQALFIEQTLESHLGIKNRRVRSEMAY
ncbi:MAG TPA: zinc ribbon domain-containing protein [Longimicrobium sp.]